MTTLAEELPKEQTRCRELLLEYRRIGSAGVFGAAAIERSLREADEAVMSGDPVAMLRSYERLKGHE